SQVAQLHPASPDGRAGGGVPQLHLAGEEGAGEEGAAIRAEGDVTDLVLMRQRLAEGSAGAGVPQPRRLVVAPGEDRAAVGAERRGDHPARMRQGWTDG